MSGQEEAECTLAPGILRQYGPPGPPPADFEDGFVLPQHSVKPLQRLNPHPLDARLVFYEKPHVYTFDGVPTSISVTGLAHAYDKPFDPQAAIQLMRSGRSQAWPRVEYVVDAQPSESVPWSVERGLLAVLAGKTCAVLPPHSLAVGTSEAQARAVLRTARNPKFLGGAAEEEEEEVYTFQRVMTDAEIKAHWNRNGMIAANKGTEAHYGAECFFNGMPIRWWEPDMRVLLEFCRRHMAPKGIIATHTEKEIVCPDADVAGSIDLIVWDSERQVHHIVDHKRSDKLQQSLRGFGKMNAPFQHLDDCKGAAYALQTSIYQFILEREYGMRIGDRVLLSLHGDKPFCTSVPYLEAEARYILECRFALVRARRQVAERDPTRFSCALSSSASKIVPAVDAVRLPDGRVAMEKAALVQELESFEPDATTRQAFEEAVQALYAPPPLPARVDTPTWRKRMPEQGIAPFL